MYWFRHQLHQLECYNGNPPPPPPLLQPIKTTPKDDSAHEQFMSKGDKW